MITDIGHPFSLRTSLPPSVIIGQQSQLAVYVVQSFARSINSCLVKELLARPSPAGAGGVRGEAATKSNPKATRAAKAASKQLQDEHSLWSKDQCTWSRGLPSPKVSVCSNTVSDSHESPGRCQDQSVLRVWTSGVCIERENSKIMSLLLRETTNIEARRTQCGPHFKAPTVSHFVQDVEKLLI